MKVCTTCKKEKPYKMFYRNKTKKDGLSSECKECAKEREKTKYQKRDYEPKYLAEHKKKYIPLNLFGQEHYKREMFLNQAADDARNKESHMWGVL